VDEVPTVLLTDAELRTLTALDSYLTIPEIASQLFLSPSTIRSQVKSIYRKLGASSRAEALAEARKRRLR
jgi:LuxR family maltose regulon positive regulatory protein